MTLAHNGPQHPDTAVVALGRPDRRHDGPLNHPIAMSATFHGADSPQPGEKVYARSSNDGWLPFEEAIASLEGSELPALAFASGMAAVSAVFGLVPVGGVLVVPGTSYNGTIGLARELHLAGAVELREIDPLDVDAGIEAFQDADLVWLESPTNPLLDVLDLPRLVDAAHEAGAIVAVDNTFSTPLRQQPLQLGADIVVHSATKFISGHSDVILGVAVTRDEDLRAKLHGRRTLGGAIPGSFETWLALRGLRTLALRLERAEQNAAEIARRLQERPEVSRVRYPGLPSDPGHERASQQLSGYGAIVSVELASAAHSERFMHALELLTPATSLGGVESLAERRRRLPTEPVQVPESLIRLSFGIEHVEDLWADILQALERSA